MIEWSNRSGHKNYLANSGKTGQMVVLCEQMYKQPLQKIIIYLQKLNLIFQREKNVY